MAAASFFALCIAAFTTHSFPKPGGLVYPVLTTPACRSLGPLTRSFNTTRGTLFQEGQVADATYDETQRGKMKFLSCFGEKQKDTLEEGLLAGQRPGCVFCDVSRDKGFDVVEEVRGPLLTDEGRHGH